MRAIVYVIIGLVLGVSIQPVLAQYAPGSDEEQAYQEGQTDGEFFSRMDAEQEAFDARMSGRSPCSPCP